MPALLRKRNQMITVQIRSNSFVWRNTTTLRQLSLWHRSKMSPLLLLNNDLDFQAIDSIASRQRLDLVSSKDRKSKEKK